MESGCESSEKGENRRGKTISHDREEGHAGPVSVFGAQQGGVVADGAADRALEAGRGRTDRCAGARQHRSVEISFHKLASPQNEAAIPLHFLVRGYTSPDGN